MLSRLATFKDYHDQTDHSCGHRKCISTLVRTGYMYDSKSGSVQCSVCNFVMENLMGSTEVILAEHQKFNSKCEYSQLENIQSSKEDVDFVSFDGMNFNPELKENIKSLRKRDKKGLEEEDATDAGGGVNRALISNTAPGITAYELQQQSKHPGLANREERVRTFRGQDHRYSRSKFTDIIKRLVDTGMYYVGPTDNVRCFFCDGGLKNFSPDDDPFDEHKKYFPDCKFIKYLIQEQLKQRNALERDTVDVGVPALSARAQYGESRAPRVQQDFAVPVRVLEGREIKARLETPIVQKLLEMGYQKEHIRQAIERRFVVYGDDFNSAFELVSDLHATHGDSIFSGLTKSIENILVSGNNQQQLQIVAISTTSNNDNPDGSFPAVASAIHRDSISATATAFNGNNMSRTRSKIQYSASADNIPEFTVQQVTTALKNENIRDPELQSEWNEFEKLSATRTCQVCYQHEIATVFLPCGHYVCCEICTPKLSHCCICRSLIRGTVKALTSVDNKDNSNIR